MRLRLRYNPMERSKSQTRSWASLLHVLATSSQEGLSSSETTAAETSTRTNSEGTSSQCATRWIASRPLGAAFRSGHYMQRPFNIEGRSTDAPTAEIACATSWAVAGLKK